MVLPSKDRRVDTRQGDNRKTNEQIFTKKKKNPARTTRLLGKDSISKGKR